MPLLPAINLAELQDALKALRLDAWLLFDFRGVNPVAARVLGLNPEDIATRRLFVWLPAAGEPIAVAHKIELQPLQDFPGEILPYAAWGELHRHLATLVRGRRIAMEFSPEDAVPYLDRVPAGVIGLIERLGGTVVSSAALVTRFAARWSAEELADHRFAAEILAEIARTTVQETVHQIGVTEHQVQERVVERMTARGLVAPFKPIVAFQANAANPHYEPKSSGSAILKSGDVVLLDLFGGRTGRTVFADQTWMGIAAGSVPERVQRAWLAVRDARDAVIQRLETVWPGERPVTGGDLDAVARQVLESRGFVQAILHRTGHSIDLDLHGSGPHLDSFETNDTRELIPGVGFSVEPGVYLPGSFGIRSEVNMVLHADRPEVTPKDRQVDLMVA